MGLTLLTYSAIFLLTLVISLRSIWLFTQNKDPLGALIPPNPVRNLYTAYKQSKEKKETQKKLDTIG